ncbi:hypothetical protein [Ramlibacter montanisoli]|uniref:Uncharacterized protein n=1 Tax=Ramlibacter montanisoli TaxID=2732512 RepID=A0A849K8R4_9BURK|nr:hypothetical protein [Ramlibacter montanisoli]NNU42824.1 hypothetical protein [Ramlibacter montanisoli]
MADVLLEAPNFSARFETLTGFAPQNLEAVPATTHNSFMVAVERELRLAGLTLAGHGDFVVTGFAALDSGPGRISVEHFQQALRSGAFIEELNRLRRQLHEDFDLDRSTSITVAGLSLGVSLVYVLWLVRGGVLLGSYLSALPAWRLLDPLPVLARAGDEEEDGDEDDETFDPDQAKGGDPLRGFT